MEKISKGEIVVRMAKPDEMQAVKIDQRLKSPRMLVAVHEGKVIGSCVFGMHPERKGTGFISSTIVDGRYQDIGIGHKLLGKAHGFFKKNGIKKIELGTSVDKEAFFEKAGYKTIRSHREDSIFWWLRMLRIGRQPRRKRT